MTPKAQAWFARVEEWRKSGETSREFCNGKGFSSQSLLWWSSELNRRTRGAGGEQSVEAPRKPSTKFARLVASPASGDAGVRVGGAEIVVRRGFDQALLGEVVRALGVAK